MGRKRIHSAVRKRLYQTSGVVQPFMGLVGNEGVDINWDVSPVSSLVIELSQRCEFQQSKTRFSKTLTSEYSKPKLCDSTNVHTKFCDQMRN